MAYILNESLLENIVIQTEEVDVYKFLYELEESYNDLFMMQVKADFVDHIAENSTDSIELQEAVSSIHEEVNEKSHCFFKSMVSKLIELVNGAVNYITRLE